MARVSTYLNFNNKTEEAFLFYKSVFGGEFTTLQRFFDVDNLPDKDKMSLEELKGIMHVALPILGGHMLLGTDALESQGFRLNMGNNVYITLEPDSKAEADRLFEKLSSGGRVEMPMADMFWGDYFGSCVDLFGVQWMVNYTKTQKKKKARIAKKI